MTLFGTDGIRGKYGDYPLDSSTIRKLGSAYLNHLMTLGLQRYL